MLDFTIDIAKKAGQIILSEKKKLVVEKKSRREIVTNADIEAQKFINERILSQFPNHDILGEESFDKEKDYSQSSHLWLIDPIDGTTNFAQGLTEYCVSIAYYNDRKPIMGVVFFPEKNLLFTAESGKKSFLNTKPIHISGKIDIKEVVLGGLFSYETEKNLTTFDLAKTLYPHIKTMRFMGSSVMDLCFSACGILDGTFGLSLKPWDMAAGYLIAKEAGAKITTLKGKSWSLFQSEILIANPHIHHQLLNIIKK